METIAPNCVAPKPVAPKRIKRGDRVRIINPELFVRCGYDICIQTEMPKIEEKYADLLDSFVAATNLSLIGRQRIVHQLAY